MNSNSVRLRCNAAAKDTVHLFSSCPLLSGHLGCLQATAGSRYFERGEQFIFLGAYDKYETSQGVTGQKEKVGDRVCSLAHLEGQKRTDLRWEVKKRVKCSKKCGSGNEAYWPAKNGSVGHVSSDSSRPCFVRWETPIEDKRKINSDGDVAERRAGCGFCGKKRCGITDMCGVLDYYIHCFKYRPTHRYIDRDTSILSKMIR